MGLFLDDAARGPSDRFGYALSALNKSVDLLRVSAHKQVA
jgi:hypothetical protein